MIGSFWNLCRACPSMPVDKLHSEYRSTYRWHEYTGPRQEVIRRAPQGGHGTTQNDEKRHDFGNATRIDEESHELPKLEPALPRRKKHPDLAYRHHEFINPEGNNLCNAPESYGDRARSEERGVSHWRPSRRSKSEGPARSNNLMNGERRRDSDPDIPDSEETGRDSGLLKKAISKISTEYRLQFAWPQGHTSRRDAANVSTPRKSQSMGALKPAANAMIHRKRTEFEPKDGTASELEPLVTQSNTIKEEDFAAKTDTEYNKEFRHFSQYQLNDGRYNKKEHEEVDDSTKHLLNGTNSEWYKEVVELRKKAGEYKNRGWGSKFVPADIYIYNKQVELWDQVSRRSSLSALSLASTAHRSYTKEEKNQENTKKSSPPKALKNAEYSTRLMKDMIRHHLERTTGGSELDGLILSPTREKLEPTIPKRDDDSRGSQKNSPKKNSPQKSALQKKNSLKSKSALRAARSHSVGPTEMTSTEKRSPKRQSRSAVKEKKGPAPGNAPNSNNVPVTKRPRPSTEPSKSEKAAPEVAEIETIDMEPVVKSPPEPTRVKSPEQIIMISPDPVNWTVPLDTGKTFTVTQNVREGDIGTRPHSEVKAWTPPEVPPPVAKSAPPQLTEQSKAQARRLQDSSSNTTVNNRTYSPKLDSKNINDAEEQPNISGAKEPVIDNKLELDVTSAATNLQTSHPNDSLDLSPTSSHALYAKKTKSLATDVLVKARDRFDSFWRKNSNEETV